MNSHEYAKRQLEEANYLLNKPAFDVPNYIKAKSYLWYMFEKDHFLAAVKALGPGRKEIGDEYVEYHPTDAPLYIRIERNSVCKLVKPAEYDCEPFLKPEDHVEIDAAAAAAQNSLDDVPF
jgi:hypothetical protein